MPGLDGMQILAQAREFFPQVPFIMLSGHGTIHTAVASLKEGAADYLQKPFKIEDLRASIERSLALRPTRQVEAGRQEGAKQKEEASRKEEATPDRGQGRYTFQQIVTKSPGMTRVLQMAEQVSAFPQTTVALYGESGVGKEVLARAIHAASGRAEERFVAVNCAGIPALLLESELFGHVRGAFTGADRDREGMFAVAQQGTLLLDEIGDMPLELQAKILRVIQERTFTPLGSNRQVQVDFRVMVATHHDLKQLVRQGKFRSDLFHRISTFPMTIPPLRERKEEIPLLASDFLNHLRREMGKSLPGISNRGMDFLVGYDWPGNIRELKNSLERAAIMVADHEFINPSHLSFLSGKKSGRHDRPKRRLSGGSDEPFELHLTLDSEEFSLDAIISKVLDMTLARCNNNKSLAAQLLKTDRRVFYRRK